VLWSMVYIVCGCVCNGGAGVFTLSVRKSLERTVSWDGALDGRTTLVCCVGSTRAWVVHLQLYVTQSETSSIWRTYDSMFYYDSMVLSCCLHLTRTSASLLCWLQWAVTVRWRSWPSVHSHSS